MKLRQQKSMFPLILQFWKVVKIIYKTNDILMIWKRDFTIFTISSQNVTFFALKGNTILIFRKRADSDPSKPSIS